MAESSKLDLLAGVRAMPATRLLPAWLLLGSVTLGLGLKLPSAHATRIPACMRVVPSGELVIRYGEHWCRR